ncbi:MAG: Na+/H+ antiporter NhaC family protein [Kluyvera sp.]
MESQKQPSFRSAVGLMVVIFIIFAAGIGVLNYPVEFTLISITIVTCFYARFYGGSWGEVMSALVGKIKDAVPAMLILLSIGMLIGCWMVSGTIPQMVFYGLAVINPAYLYLTAFLVTVCISTFTGTSWGTAGTIGVALIAVASAMDVSLPAFVFACVGFYLLGNHLQAGSPEQLQAIKVMKSALSTTFWLNPLLLSPALLVLIGAIRKWDSVIVLVASALFGILLAVLFQQITLADIISSAINGFKSEMLPSLQALELDEATARNITVLLNRGGMYSMVSPIVVMLCAFLFASALEVSGALAVILKSLVQKLYTITRTLLATIFTSAILVACTGNAVISFFIVKSMYDPCYKEKKLHMVNMSRAMESGATLLEGLFPWTISGMFMAKTLGVATLDYAPYVLFNLSCLVMALIFTVLPRWTNFGTRYVTPAA